jgi:hypothetical protein
MKNEIDRDMIGAAVLAYHPLPAAQGPGSGDGGRGLER